MALPTTRKTTLSGHSNLQIGNLILPMMELFMTSIGLVIRKFSKNFTLENP